MERVSNTAVKMRATLSKKEAEKFQEDFNELESERFTDISLVEDGENMIITLTCDKYGLNLLLASMETGLLHFWGWDKKFFEVK